MTAWPWQRADRGSSAEYRGVRLVTRLHAGGGWSWGAIGVTAWSPAYPTAGAIEASGREVDEHAARRVAEYHGARYLELAAAKTQVDPFTKPEALQREPGQEG